MFLFINGKFQGRIMRSRTTKTQNFGGKSKIYNEIAKKLTKMNAD